jgi:hypothetical protein
MVSNEVRAGRESGPHLDRARFGPLADREPQRVARTVDAPVSTAARSRGATTLRQQVISPSITMQPLFPSLK